ncbi:MAG: Rha family transcriptional regulator [Ruminococcus flavefaciens]|nr:Rha family transcriptional regulator [Ruminococcus flavefaciens]MCM1062573.1 Rha family transcriptional regulator [Eubacterium sp.]
MNEIIINNFNGTLTVSSLQVAKDFDKRHDKLVAEIERMYGELIGYAQNGGDPFFIEKSYQHPQNKQWYKSYELTRDGFSLLVMGFTGKKALEWKLKYIEAFNLMEDKLRNGLNSINIEEIIVKSVSLAVSETIKALMPFIMKSAAPPAPEPAKRIKRRYKYTTPSKISTLDPELKRQVDEMIVSGEYSCQKIANFIMNNSDIEISQMAVNRYKHNYFCFDDDMQLTLF